MMINITYEEKRELLDDIDKKYRNLSDAERFDLSLVAMMLKLFEKNNGVPARNMEELEKWYNANKAEIDALPDPEDTYRDPRG